MTKILRVGNAAAAAAGAVLATGAFALAPASPSQAARGASTARAFTARAFTTRASTARASTAPTARASTARSIATTPTARSFTTTRTLPAARPAAGTGRVLPGQPMVPAGPGQQNPATQSGALAVTRSENWAGYATTKGGRSFRLVQATFFVPYLNCALTPGTFSTHWVGLDGFSSKSVEQDGIEADCVGSTGQTPRYRAFFEMFPKPEAVTTLTVSAGDSVTATVSYSSASRRFRLTVTDNSSGRHFSVSQACAAASCPRTSAEAISEAPTDSANQLLPLADYGAVGFTNIAITEGPGQRGGLNSRFWRTTKIIQYGAASRKRIAQPTAVHASGFANYWLGEN